MSLSLCLIQGEQGAQGVIGPRGVPGEGFPGAKVGFIFVNVRLEFKYFPFQLVMICLSMCLRVIEAPLGREG